MDLDKSQAARDYVAGLTKRRYIVAGRPGDDYAAIDRLLVEGAVDAP